MLSQYNLAESVKGKLRIKVDLEQAMIAPRGGGGDRGIGLAVLYALEAGPSGRAV